MQSKISSMLDAVAESLEAKGLVKEAYEIDKIADNIEKVSGLYGTLGEFGNRPDTFQPWDVPQSNRKNWRDFSGQEFIHKDLPSVKQAIENKFPYFTVNPQHVEKDIRDKGYSQIGKRDRISIQVYIRSIPQGYWVGYAATYPEKHPDLVDFFIPIEK